nr:MAG TPA: hypothetical protein [Caudoviricetes sp.]
MYFKGVKLRSVSQVGVLQKSKGTGETLLT